MGDGVGGVAGAGVAGGGVAGGSGAAHGGEGGGVEGVRAAEYDRACRALQAQPAAPGQPAAAAEAAQLIFSVLARSDGQHVAEGNAAMRSTELLAALTVLRHLREEIAGWEPQLIAKARGYGVSWAALAPALGVTSRQAAERRYLRLRPSETGETTGEERVRAERTKRAGDRAVTQWARQNSAVLRQLAGQVSALDGLSVSGQHHADRVQQALADDDPTRLLSPLADTHSHLTATHAGLAEQIHTITEHAAKLRRDVQQG